MERNWRSCVLAGCLLGAAASAPGGEGPPVLENLALRATATADAEIFEASWRNNYRAANACDGCLPPGGMGDSGKAWAVEAKDHPQGAGLTFTWPEPVRVAQVVYFARSASTQAQEYWKRCAVYDDVGLEPLLTAKLTPGYGPQVIDLPAPTETGKLRLHFTGCQAGRPGAAEVFDFARPLGADVFRIAYPVPYHYHLPPTSVKPALLYPRELQHFAPLAFFERKGTVGQTLAAVRGRYAEWRRRIAGPGPVHAHKFYTYRDNVPGYISQPGQSKQREEVSIDISGWKQVWVTMDGWWFRFELGHTSPWFQFLEPTLIRADGTAVPLVEQKLIWALGTHGTGINRPKEKRPNWGAFSGGRGRHGLSMGFDGQVGFALDGEYKALKAVGTTSGKYAYEKVWTISSGPPLDRAKAIWDALDRHFPYDACFLDWLARQARFYGRDWLNARPDADLERRWLAQIGKSWPEETDGLARSVRQLADAGAGTDDARWIELICSSARRLRKTHLRNLLAKADKLVVLSRGYFHDYAVYALWRADGLRPGGGSLLACTLNEREEPEFRAIHRTNKQLIDLDVSFDGKEIVFCEGCQLYRINADGSGLTLLSDGKHKYTSPAWLPDGGIAFLATLPKQYSPAGAAEALGVLYRMDRDGGNVRRLSFNPFCDYSPSVLDTGQILFCRWELVDRSPEPIQGLWTINPDGSGLGVYYGNRTISPEVYFDARPIPGTQKVVSALTAQLTGAFYGGGLAVIDPRYGVNAAESIRDVVPVKQRTYASIARFMNSLEGPANLVPDRPVVQIDHPKSQPTFGPYNTPCPIDERYCLATRWEGPGYAFVVARTYDGAVEIPLLFPLPDTHLGLFFAEPLQPRPRPPAYQSALPADPQPWGALYVQDVYQGLLPQVKRGEVARIAVVEVLPKPQPHGGPGLGGGNTPISANGTLTAKKVWGFAPVAADGSAYFKVPAETPVYFLALDAQGRAVQRMRSFTHLAPGEVQGCIGCHESRRHATTSSNRPAALLGPPAELEPPDWSRMGFCYCRIVQPVWDAHCVKCHNEQKPPAGIDLTGDKTPLFNISYTHLVWKHAQAEGGAPAGRYVNFIPTDHANSTNIFRVEPKAWGSVRSRLADLLLAGHPDADGKKRAQLTQAELARVFTWIDLDVPYYGTAYVSRPRSAGLGRRYVPADLGKVYGDVFKRRCASCHGRGAPAAKAATGLGNVDAARFRGEPSFLRLTRPEKNAFLAAPLAKAAGGWQRYGEAIFASTDDVDYRKILQTFDSVLQEWKARPRMDLPAADLEAANAYRGAEPESPE